MIQIQLTWIKATGRRVCPFAIVLFLLCRRLSVMHATMSSKTPLALVLLEKNLRTQIGQDCGVSRCPVEGKSIAKNIGSILFVVESYREILCVERRCHSQWIHFLGILKIITFWDQRNVFNHKPRLNLSIKLNYIMNISRESECEWRYAQL